MREVSFGKRLLSMLLALVLILGILPVGNLSGLFTKANAADDASTKAPVDAAIMFSDLHTNSSDYKKEELEAIMSAFKNTGMPYTSVTSCGDAFSVNADNTKYNGYSDTLVGYIKGSGGLGDSSVDVNFVWSDHDRYVYNNSTDMVLLDKKSHLAYGAGNDGVYGTADDDNYYVYALSMGDLCSYDRYKAGFNYTTSSNNRVANGFTATVEEAIANFKADAAKLDKSKPLLIASHQPLYDNRNDNAWAEAWFDAINEIAEEMDIVFFYGHNHKYDKASDYYYGKGSVMPVATADNWNYNYETGVGYKPSINLTAENKTLNFTHMCAGYLEPTSTGSYDATTTRRGTAISIVIYEDSLVLQTYDAKGLYTGSYAVNETVKRDHAKVETTPDPEPETPTSVTLKDEATGVVVSAPELKTLGVTTVSTPDAVKDLLTGTTVAYDITVTGFSGTASVTINIPEGVNADQFAVFYVPETGSPVKMPGAASEDGKTYTFTTTHFSVYVGGKLSNGTAVGEGATGTGQLVGTPAVPESETYKYVLDTNGVNAGTKYLIVNTSSNGTAYVLTNNNGNVGRTNVTISNGAIIVDDDTNIAWTFSGSNSGTVGNQGRYIYPNNGSLSLNTSGTSMTISNQGNGAYRVYRTGTEGRTTYNYFIRYNNNAWTGYRRNTNQTGSNVYLFAYDSTITTPATPAVPGAEVTFTLQNTEILYNGDTQDLVYEITLSNGTRVTSADITWDSGANTYFTVTNGKMTATNNAKTEQTTYVKATLNSVNGTALADPIEIQVPVVVKPYTATLDVTPSNANLLPGETVQLNAAVTYNGMATADHSVISWTSSDPTVATVNSNGLVSAHKVGTADITATITTVEGKSVTLTDTVHVSVEEKKAQEISVTPTTITVERDAVTSMKVATIVVYYGQGEAFREVPMTLGMLKGDYNLSENGIYEGLSVTYAGQTYTGITLKVVDKAGDNYPEYPTPGSVNVNKTADATYLQQYGVVNVELSTSGLPISKGVDVIVMLDMSSSMTRCIDHDTKNCKVAGCSGTRLAALKTALATFESELDKAPNKDNIKVAVADFNGFYSSGAVARDGKDHMSDDSQLNGSATNYIFTSSNNAINAAAFVPVSELNTASFNLNPATGTNYDYAFDTIYQLGTAIRQQNAQNGQADRELVVLFMSDGAANQYNFYHSIGGDQAEDPNYDWNHWLQGTMTDTDLTDGTNGRLNNDTHAYYYDKIDHDGDGFVNEHRMANAIKGDPNKTYEVIRKSASVAGGVTLENAKDANGNVTHSDLYMAPGLGATMYSVAFDIAHDGKITADSVFHILEQAATSDEFYVNAASEADLKAAFQNFASAIVYAASDAYFVDQMGDSFNLQILPYVEKRLNDGTVQKINLPVAPKIRVYNYEIYKATDTGVTEDQIGKRKGSPATMEEITFNADGTVTSSLDTIGPDGKTTIPAGQNIYIDGVIYAKYFYYNNNLTSVKIANGTTTTTVEPETFRWNIGIINNVEWALNYWTYLEGSMDGNTSSGSYKTNNYAILYYKNYLGNNAFLPTTSPQVGWESANVSYAFYLVNDQGIPVVNQTTGQTGNFTNAVKVTNPVVYDEILLNNLDDIDTIEAKSNTILPSGYTLFDEAAAYKVVVLSDDGKGAWTISVGDDKPLTTYVTGHAGSDATTDTKVTGKVVDGMTGYDLHANYDYTHTTVWFAVVWVPQALPDAVVVDYGLPVDISVLVNDQFGTNGKLSGVGTTDAKDTALDSAEGTNIYTGEHNAAFKDKITVNYGTAETFGDKVRYTPTTMDWGTGDVAFDKFAYEVEYDYNQYDEDGNFVADLGTQYYYGDVTVIPATSVYYEDNHTAITYGGTAKWKVVTGTNTTQDEDRPGKYSISQIDKNNVYGYDSHYTTMAEYSMNNVHYVTVDKDTYATATFTFHGTGFDVISLTSSQTGILIAQVYNAAGTLVKTQVVDTYYGYTKNADGEWVTTTDTDNALYQVPVLSVEKLPYAQYTVKFTASYYDALNNNRVEDENGKNFGDGSYDLYLDAIRIFDPAGDGNDLAIGDMTISDIYAQDGEGWPIYDELRNQLIDEETYKNETDNSKFQGAIFIDGNGINYSVSDYTNYGPNNELYLAPGQVVAFELDLSDYIQALRDAQGNEILDKNRDPVIGSIVADVQLGVKSANGEHVKVTLTADNVSASREFDTSTEMYYSFSQLLDLGADATGVDTSNDSKTIVYVKNSGSDGLASITNIKVTFKQHPVNILDEQPQILFWSRNIGESVLTMLMNSVSNDDVPETEDPTPGENEPETEDPTEGETPEDEKPEEEKPDVETPEVETPEDEETNEDSDEDTDSDAADDINPETGSRLSAFFGMIFRFFRNIFGWIFN